MQYSVYFYGEMRPLALWLSYVRFRARLKSLHNDHVSLASCPVAYKCERTGPQHEHTLWSVPHDVRAYFHSVGVKRELEK